MFAGRAEGAYDGWVGRRVRFLEFAEVAGEAVWHSSLASATGHDGGHGAAEDVHSSGANGPVRKVGVFTADQGTPASQSRVGAGANPEVGAVNVGVSIAQIVRAEPCVFGLWREAVPGHHGPDDRIGASVGLLDHPGEPVLCDV